MAQRDSTVPKAANKVTAGEDLENEKTVKELVSWFISSLAIVVVVGILFGAFCVLACMCHYQKR